ncbi:hypothetical protein K438DRAFT_1802473 [Mycena galopus ATCC 62051]|nr:hypothetical protein K438DRAFT_1802473 [Mycena galopus ATCC 62051]
MSSPTTENNAPGPAVFVPTSPFAKAPGADAILRSSDGADFYVHRAILAFVSPIFRVQENSSILDRALRFFYPGEQPAIARLDELREVIEVLITKYDVQCVIPAVKQHLRKYMVDQPLGVYAVALTYGWRDVAKEAARHCLKLPLRDRLGNKAPPGLDQITGTAYHNLLQYHHLCGAAASKSFQTLSWVTASSPGYWFCCNGCKDKSLQQWTFSDGAGRRIPAWFQQYLEGMAGASAVTPGKHLIDNNFYFLNAFTKAHCDNCASNMNWLMVFNFISTELSNRMNAEIDKVELEFASS